MTSEPWVRHVDVLKVLSCERVNIMYPQGATIIFLTISLIKFSAESTYMKCNLARMSAFMRLAG